MAETALDRAIAELLEAVAGLPRRSRAEAPRMIRRLAHRVRNAEADRQRRRLPIVGDGAIDEAEIRRAQKQRPKTRADCANVPRPCPWAGCRYHLAVDVRPTNGTLFVSLPAADYRTSSGGDGSGRALHPQKVPGGRAEVARVITAAVDRVVSMDPRWSCALDVADRVAAGEEIDNLRIGHALGTSNERPRQILEEALAKLRDVGLNLNERTDR